MATSEACRGGLGALPIDPEARAKPRARMCSQCLRSRSQLIGRACQCQQRCSRFDVRALTAATRPLREWPDLWRLEAGRGRCPLVLKCVQSHKLACARHASVATAIGPTGPPPTVKRICRRFFPPATWKNPHLQPKKWRVAPASVHAARTLCCTGTAPLYV